MATTFAAGSLVGAGRRLAADDGFADGGVVVAGVAARAGAAWTGFAGPGSDRAAVGRVLERSNAGPVVAGVDAGVDTRCVPAAPVLVDVAFAGTGTPVKAGIGSSDVLVTARGAATAGDGAIAMAGGSAGLVRRVGVGADFAGATVGTSPAIGGAGVLTVGFDVATAAGGSLGLAVSTGLGVAVSTGLGVAVSTGLGVAVSTGLGGAVGVGRSMGVGGSTGAIVDCLGSLVVISLIACAVAGGRWRGGASGAEVRSAGGMTGVATIDAGRSTTRPPPCRSPPLNTWPTGSSWPGTSAAR